MEISDKSIEIIKPRRCWLRLLKRFGWGLLILLILAICVWVWWHHTLQQRLDEALAELDRTDPGWRLEDVEAARERIAEEQNSARIVVAAGKLLPHPWPPKEFDDRFLVRPPPELLAADDFARLAKELDARAAALEEARKLANHPNGRHRIVYRPDMSTSLEDQALTRFISALLSYDVDRYAQMQNPKAALASCRAILNAARSIGDEPLAVSQLHRIAWIAVGCRAIERTLAQGEPPLEALRTTQNILDNEDAFSELFITARGERAVTHDTYDAIENGKMHVISLSTNRPPDWMERLKGPIYRALILNEHPTMLALMGRWVAIARLPSQEQSAAEKQLGHDIRNLPKNAILTRLIIPSVTKLGTASRRKHAILRCTIAALAAERHRQTHKKWPDFLEKLCPRFLDSVPLDPFNGAPLRYRRFGDGVVIYTVGDDGVDNGGSVDRDPNDADSGADIGFRSWDAAKRRQPPRPKPPDEEKPR